MQSKNIRVISFKDRISNVDEVTFDKINIFNSSFSFIKIYEER
jgi:hypothetical protein